MVLRVFTKLRLTGFWPPVCGSKSMVTRHRVVAISGPTWFVAQLSHRTEITPAELRPPPLQTICVLLFSKWIISFIPMRQAAQCSHTNEYDRGTRHVCVLVPTDKLTHRNLYFLLGRGNCARLTRLKPSRVSSVNALS